MRALRERDHREHADQIVRYKQTIEGLPSRDLTRTIGGACAANGPGTSASRNSDRSSAVSGPATLE